MNMQVISLDKSFSFKLNPVQAPCPECSSIALPTKYEWVDRTSSNNWLDGNMYGFQPNSVADVMAYPMEWYKTSAMIRLIISATISTSYTYRVRENKLSQSTNYKETTKVIGPLEHSGFLDYYYLFEAWSVDFTSDVWGIQVRDMRLEIPGEYHDIMVAVQSLEPVA
jgi:hypothetical protein